MTDREFAARYAEGFTRTVQFLRSRGAKFDSEEFAQAAWVRGWERRDQIRQPSSLLVWINSIAINLYREYLRHQATALSECEHSLGAQQHNIVAVLELSRRLKACSPEQRSLLERVYLRGDSIRDLAVQNKCSDVAIRIRLHRARQKLAMVG